MNASIRKQKPDFRHGLRVSGSKAAEAWPIRLLLLALFALILAGCGRYARTGLTEKRLAPCPNSPNCVTSQTDMVAGEYIEPLNYSGSRQQARSALLSVLDSMERTRIIAEGENYIHVEFRSRIFRFVDDVEFYFPETLSIIEVRSSSRTGYYDFGVNRTRVETIRRLFRDKMQMEIVPPEIK